MEIKGIGVFSGIGIGTAARFAEEVFEYPARRSGTASQEIERLMKATEDFTREVQRMADVMRERVGSAEADILSVQIAIVQDQSLRMQTDELVEAGASAEAALDEVCQRYIKMFETAGSELMSLRAADVRDLRGRMLALLTGKTLRSLKEFAPGTVLAARDLTPTMTAGLDPACIEGIVTERGGLTSHSAILARAMGIPSVLGAVGLMDAVHTGETVVVDGEHGTVWLSPGAGQLAAFRARKAMYETYRRELENYRGKPTCTADGAKVQLMANISSPDEMARVLEAGADGIGLMRTEFLLAGRTAMPTEEEQLAAYRAVADAMPDRPVAIQAFDVGGDKFPPCMHFLPEKNPYLGERGIRYLLNHEDLFRTQLRALLRAGAAHGNVWIALPFVTGAAEVEYTRDLLEQCKSQLEHEGLAFDRGARLGLMAETPAAAFAADLFARRVDFFLMGTNDLVQYMLATDRENPRIAQRYTPFHPAVLRAVRATVKAAQEAGVPVWMCGEIAADERMTPLLLSFGLDALSVNGPSLTAIRKAVSIWKRQDADEVARHVMELETAREIEEYLSAITRAPMEF